MLLNWRCRYCCRPYGEHMARTLACPTRTGHHFAAKEYSVGPNRIGEALRETREANKKRRMSA